MLVKTNGRSNPFTEISRIAGLWFFWGVIFGVCLVATAQRVVSCIESTTAIPPSAGPNPPVSAPALGAGPTLPSN